MKYALCVKLCQHDFTIVIVHKLLVHGHCSESGLHSLPSRSSRCPRSMPPLPPPAAACRLQILKRTRGKLMHNATDPNLCCPSNEQFVICRSWICPKKENFKTVKHLHLSELAFIYQFYTKMTVLLELTF